MIKLKVEVDDWDTGETVKLTLPCDVRQKVDMSHDLQIIDWDSLMSIGFDDVKKLNEAIEDMNAENPLMTLELLEKILDASATTTLCDKEFQRKICSSDFMLEKVERNMWKLKSKEEQCACFLATELLIPFAKNISEDFLESIRIDKIDKVKWNVVWDYYSRMGFKIIEYKKSVYAFHWGDAEE